MRDRIPLRLEANRIFYIAVNELKSESMDFAPEKYAGKLFKEPSVDHEDRALFSPRELDFVSCVYATGSGLRPGRGEKPDAIGRLATRNAGRPRGGALLLPAYRYPAGHCRKLSGCVRCDRHRSQG